jgi:hypothetical protein
MKDYKMKLSAKALHMPKMKLSALGARSKKVITVVCAICLFIGGGIAGSQIYVNALDNAVATLPVAKGGTGQTSLASVLGVGSALTAGSMTTLKTARTINNVSFNGSANITLPIYGAYGSYSTDRVYFKASTPIPSGTKLIFSGTYQCAESASAAVTVNKSGGTTWSGTTLKTGMAFKSGDTVNFNVALTTTSNLSVGNTLFTLYGEVTASTNIYGGATVYAPARTMSL